LKKNTNYTENEKSFIITVEVVSTHEGHMKVKVISTWLAPPQPPIINAWQSLNAHYSKRSETLVKVIKSK